MYSPSQLSVLMLSDLTTRKVIIGVLAMLFILPLFDIGGGYLGDASFAEPMGLQMLHYTYATSGSTPEFESEKGTYLQMTTGAKKGGKKGKHSKGRGKGKGGKGQFDSRNPNRLPPPDWDRAKGAWKCTCGQFNQHWKNWCSFCSTPKPQ